MVPTLLTMPILPALVMGGAVRHVWPLWKQPTIMSPDLITNRRLQLVGDPAVLIILSLSLCIFQVRRAWISGAVEVRAVGLTAYAAQCIRAIATSRSEKQRARKLVEH